MGMMIRHNRLRKAQGTADAAPTSFQVKEAVQDKASEKTADAAVSKRGRKKAE